MPAAMALAVQRHDQVEEFRAANRRLSKGCGCTTAKAARSFVANLQGAGGWERLSVDEQIDASVTAVDLCRLAQLGSPMIGHCRHEALDVVPALTLEVLSLNPASLSLA